MRTAARTVLAQARDGVRLNHGACEREDAIDHWEFEPLQVNSIAVPVCMTVTVNINWR
jgi:hypothetical protein